VDVIITSDPAKLPPEILALQDENQPLPQDAQFFEQRFTFSELLKTAAIGAVLAFLGLITFIFFIYSVIDLFGPTTVAYSNYQSQTIFGSLAVSGVFFFASYLMLGSIKPAFGLAWSGRHSRYGITLLGDRFVSHSLFDTTVIPREKFISLVAGKVNYRLGEKDSWFMLPDIAGGRRPQLEAAIQSWKAVSG
jgi:hypothetical protein